MDVSGELIAAALKAGEEHALRDWILLRRADAGGRGYVRLDAFLGCLANLGLARQTRKDIVARLVGSGFAARSVNPYGDVVLRPLSVQQAHERYRVAGRWAVTVDVEGLVGRGLRNRLFSHVQAAHGSGPIARATLTAMTGVSKPTQIRGERRNGATVTSNFIRVDDLEKAPVLSLGHRVHVQDGQLFVQTANSTTYAIPRRKLRGRPGCRATAHRQELRRRYFTEAKKALKAKVWTNGSPALLEEQPRRFGKENRKARVWCPA